MYTLKTVSTGDALGGSAWNYLLFLVANTIVGQGAQGDESPHRQ